jgi:hypothetical protein
LGFAFSNQFLSTVYSKLKFSSIKLTIKENFSTCQGRFENIFSTQIKGCLT